MTAKLDATPGSIPSKDASAQIRSNLRTTSQIVIKAVTNLFYHKINN